MNLDLKICQYCKKEVSKEAIKCPYCQEWLNKKELSLKNPYAITFVLVLLVPFMSYLYRRVFIEKKLTDIYQWAPKYKADSKLFILNHKLVKGKNSFSIIGEIENREQFKWSSVSILVAFKDSKNNFSSLASGYVSNLSANSTKPFKVTVGCSQEPYDPKIYSSYTIEIEEARGEYNYQK